MRLSTYAPLTRYHIAIKSHFRPDDKLWLLNTGSTCYSFSLSDYTSRTTYCTDKHYYICEQAGPHDMQLSTTNFIVDSYSGTKEITWTKISFGSKQLTIEDEGQYECFASNTVGQTFYEFSQTLNVKVPSQPSTTNITSSPCNSNLLVTWKPHVRGVGIEHRFQIMDPINSNNYKVFLTTPNNVSMTSNVTGLQPSTSYIIKIEPCLNTPSICLSHYATTTNATTGGLPGPVTKPSLEMTYDGSCNLVLASTKAILSSYYEDDFETNEIFLISEKTSYVLPKVFNRKYNVSIQAKTCAGFGPGSEAVGGCVTDTNAPSNIQAPSTRGEISGSGILEFTINIPDGTNGPISCYFIIVQLNETSNTLPDFNNARMNKLNNLEIEDEYIAIALIRTSVGHNRPKMSLILGDQAKTKCDISGNNNSGNGNNSKYTYAAYNKRLSLDETYRIFLVTSTPTKKGVSFGASDALVIGKRFPDITLAVVAGGILVLLSAFVCLCYLRHRNNKRKNKVPGTISSISFNVSKKEKLEHVSAAGTIITQHHLNTSINTYETITEASNGYEDITDPPEWNPYEIAVSQYETVL
ncbi:uncharacterized protein LOC144420898 [Styela clava]